MKGLFPTLLAILFGLAFEEFYAETALPEEDLLLVLSALPICILPLVFSEALLLHVRRRLRAGRAVDVQRFAPFVARAPLPLYIVIVFVCRWPTVLVPLGLESAVLADHLVTLAPYFVLYLICLVESLRLRRPIYLEAGEVKTAGVRDVAASIADNLRHIGLLLVPLLVLVLLLDLVSDTELRVWFKKLTIFGLAFLLLLFGMLTLVYPELFRISMNLKPLVEGSPLRQRLAELSQRLGFRCRQVLYWPSERPMYNAMIVGVVPRFRYVILTEELCKRLTLDELCAVFAHEVGHGKRHHALFYVLLSVTVLALLLPVGDWVGQEVAWLSRGRIDATLATTLFAYLPAFTLYWKLVLDALSKRFELEADVFGVESTKNSSLFITTLEKVARLARLERRSAPLRHFSIEGRVDFLRRAFLENETALLERFRSQIRIVRQSILAAACVVLVIAATWIGFQSLRGYASILLDRGETDRATRLAERLVSVRSSDVVALALLSEIELYRKGDGDTAPERWQDVLTRRPDVRPAEMNALVEELRAGWTRAVLCDRTDVADEMLDRMESLTDTRSGEERLSDSYFSEHIDALRVATRLVERGSGAEIEALLEANPRWLRRPDMRPIATRLSNLADARKPR